VLIAADTNVLLDQAKGIESIADCLDVCRERLKIDHFLVTPTVLQELAQQLDFGDTKEEREWAHSALTKMRSWGYREMNLIPVDHGVVEQIGFKLRLRGIIPEEEKNDSYIIAEAALLGCAILLSSDGHMLDAQENHALRKCLADCDVEGQDMAIASPETIVRNFAPKIPRKRRT
jgi:hypothetical protein